ncbi:MAG: MBL fold metallo-hydrolase, partial [Actinomycetota bacterium]
MVGMLDRSAALVDGTSADTLKLSVAATAAEPEVLGGGVTVVESFSNVVSFDTDEGLVLFDVSHLLSAPQVVEQLRRHSTA